ncbi:glutamate--cysteine ligase catalytic subunit-like isoform X1 [Pocillopora verrucosa]|uniref:glutamate--cysteine ligase catalytic subunit-like isoform X1 n=3 Tax=Pocillopora verrucosa TaxID=203993 RepID=UPI00333EEC12
MGLLSKGCPLSWSETKQYRDEVRKRGVLQFLHIYNREKDRDNDGLKWGDEMEYTLLKFDHENKRVYCNLRAKDVLDDLTLVEQNNASTYPISWKPEFASYMVEASPGQPMGESLACFNIIELNMSLRREEMKRFLTEPGETVQSIVAFPRLGCPNFTFPFFEPTPNKGLSCSMFIPDQAVCQNQLRFSSMTQNIRERRGSKVAINVPIFKDINTPSPFTETFPTVEGEGAEAALPDHIYMDSVSCGLGMSCIQVTLQACNIHEARFLYDQLAVVSPVLMALSAGTPIARGYLSDVDCRWGIISESTDDRTPEERGLEPLKENKFVIPKSRYDSVSTYLSAEANGYNDIDLVYDQDIYQQLVVAGVDEPLARHVAHLFIRDPVASLCLEDLYKDDEGSSNLFENINSTNWQTVRFKPPPPDSSMGWRVEFRSLDVQLTDFENAAFVTFVILLTRAILSFDLNLLIPISKVDENMVKAQKRDAVRQGEFSFRKNVWKSVVVREAENCHSSAEFELMSIDKIINGKDNEFPGLIPLINRYLATTDVDFNTRCTISQYLNHISKKASGELLTTAQWIRRFVESHTEYKRDSVVSEGICFDLLRKIDCVGQGETKAPELFGEAATLRMGDAVFKKYLEIKGKIKSFEEDGKIKNNILMRWNLLKPNC